MPFDPNQANPDPAQQQTQQAGQPQLYAGKYPTIEELERGYNHQFRETQSIIQQRDELQQRLEALLPLVTAGAAPGNPTPPSPAPAQPSFDVNDPNAVLAAIRQAAREEALAAVRPMGAVQEYEMENPEFAKFKPEFGQFLRANPAIANRVAQVAQTDPTVALDYGFRQFQQSRQSAAATTQATQQITQRIDASGQQQAQARLDAAIPSGSVTDRSASVASQGQAELDALKKAAQETGNVEPYVLAVLGKLVQHPDLPA